jgi:prepilin-type processing-associated H-X9-DG protein/prepilin-type N-terminal cleavage/methylation domain-containing protein
MHFPLVGGLQTFRKFRQYSTRFGSKALGFTLVELLVSVAIAGFLAALVVPATSLAFRRSRASHCAGQIRQFGLAVHMYADDNGGRFPPNFSGPDQPLGKTWVTGWEGVPGPDCTNTDLLRQSLLAPYVKTAALWRCPSVRPVFAAGETMDRVRTVSLNCFLGDSQMREKGFACPTVQSLEPAGPSGIFTIIEERAETINDASFAIQAGFDAARPELWVLRDKPAALHEDRGNLAFADGHVEAHRWSDQRTLHPLRDDASTPGNADVNWLGGHARPAVDPRP